MCRCTPCRDEVRCISTAIPLKPCTGLREVTNPSEMLLSQNNESLSGTAIGVTIDGTRPFLIEVQSLVSTAAYGTAQRSVTG